MGSLLAGGNECAQVRVVSLWICDSQGSRRERRSRKRGGLVVSGEDRLSTSSVVPSPRLHAFSYRFAMEEIAKNKMMHAQLALLLIIVGGGITVALELC